MSVNHLSEKTYAMKAQYDTVDIIIVGISVVAFFFLLVPPAPLFFFGESCDGAVAVGVPTVIGVSGPGPSPSAALGFGAAFFLFAALAAAGALLSTWPSGPSFVCAGVGWSSGRMMYGGGCVGCSGCDGCGGGGVSVGGPYVLWGMNTAGCPGAAIGSGAPGSGGIVGRGGGAMGMTAAVRVAMRD